MAHVNPSNPGGAWAEKPFRDALRRAILRTDAKSKAIQLDRIAEALISAAAEGNVQAMKEIGDRLDGRVSQQVEMTGANGGPVQTQAVVHYVSPTQD